MSQAADQQAQSIMEDRRNILESLNMRYPNYISGSTIFKIILGNSQDYTKRRLVRDMTYFNEKGYVKFRGLHGIEAMSINVNDCAFALTAAGMDVAQRLVRDQALDV